MLAWKHLQTEQYINSYISVMCIIFNTNHKLCSQYKIVNIVSINLCHWTILKVKVIISESKIELKNGVKN